MVRLQIINGRKHQDTSVAQIVSATSATTVVNNLIEGIYTFHLTVKDDSSAVASTDITLTVNSRVLIDLGPTSTTGPDAGGKYWNNVADGLAGIKLQNAVATGNVPTSIGFEIINRIDGTFNPAGPGTNTGNTAGDIGDYPASATTDYAFAHPTATNGQWKLTGLDSSKQYTIKFWGTRSGVGDQRYIQIKRTDETTYQQYDGSNNTDYNNAAVFTFTGKTNVTFDIKVRDGDAFGYISLIDIKAITPQVNCTPAISIASSATTIVCPGTTVTFTATPTNAGASPAYQWKLNGADISGATASTFATSTLANGDNVSCVITTSNFCFSGTTATSNVIAAPIAPALGALSEISGPTNACQYIGTSTQVTYSIAAVTNATSYTWTLPANTTLVSGQGTSSVIIKFNTGFTSSVIKVKAISTCFVSADKSLTITAPTNATPGAISGPTNACAFIGVTDQATYTIAKVTNALAYVWTVPTGVTIASHPGGTGVNDTIIKVTFATTFVSGTAITVKSSGCNLSAASSLIILKSGAPAVPGTITGPTNACAYAGTATKAIYTIAKVNFASSYTWTLPSGATATHPNGTGSNDTIISVTYSSGFSSGSITVKAVNGCGTSAAKSLAITKTAPAGTPVISGPTDPCPWIGTTGATYKINRNAEATSYTWTVPATGTTVTHPNGTGINDTIIIVNYTSAFTSGNITVKAVANCGSGATGTLAIAKVLPSTPSTITVKQVSACPTRIYTYSLTGMPANATSVTWTVPSGGTITSGQGTISINVTYSTSIILGSVTATGKNNCSTGSARSTSVLLGLCLGAKTTGKGENIPATSESKVEEKEVNGLDVAVMPNPTYNTFKLIVTSNDNKTATYLRITDMSGKLLEMRQGIVPGQAITLGNNYMKGIYIGEIIQGNNRKIIKLIKL
ncbi:MAG: T9SS type A sorting domain-containing protein [Ferruginibacter sp.]